jgi:hypothetical protein
MEVGHADDNARARVGPRINVLNSASTRTLAKNDLPSEENAEKREAPRTKKLKHSSTRTTSKDAGASETQAGEDHKSNLDHWYWDATYNTWVYTAPKRVRKKDLSNKMLKNWRLGMRRNSNSVKKDKLLKKITITRANISTVRIFLL